METANIAEIEPLTYGVGKLKTKFATKTEISDKVIFNNSSRRHLSVSAQEILITGLTIAKGTTLQSF